MPPPNDARLTFTVSEFSAAIEALRPVDLGLLDKVARIYAAKTNGRMSPTDLQQEAVKRTLSGVRSWNREVSVVQHLIGVMRSVAWHQAKKEHPEWEAPGADPDAEAAKAGVKLLVEHLEEKLDEDALIVLQELAEGAELGDIRTSLGLDAVALETIIKRIRRAGERLRVTAGRSTR